jgi:hypothetical protein
MTIGEFGDGSCFLMTIGEFGDGYVPVRYVCGSVMPCKTVTLGYLILLT